MCGCKICKITDKFKWATIRECYCGCHSIRGIFGHDSLCCAYVNGKEYKNPYKKLGKAKYYETKLNKIIGSS